MSLPTDRDIEIFTLALRLPVGERADFLDQTCGRDRSLHDKVLALLSTHDRAGDFLERPATGVLPEIEDQSQIGPGERPGDRVGRYKLLQQIGEGGCGIVFMAEQEEPVRRRVALKIVKPGMDTRSVVARFEAERHALALMDHPSIAKVFDAGATESGRPYFVMELIRGVKITEYCDERSLTTEERLDLFVQVCNAVQHAHQKGIIHRDIKPSNILVTTAADNEALPVVIDFGIAKATTNQRLTDKTLFTAFEMLIGTPAYMSPEQANLTSIEVDTRTDVYSLGVLLYELLTGSTPFDTGELLKRGLDEIRRVIREEEPVRPSTRLSRMQVFDLTTIAQRRKSDSPKLIRAICGDLDWIVMKALEKDRACRYETANGIALDVKRFLADEVILARPPSKLYRFKKILLRNKMLFVGVGIIATLLIASLIVVSASLAGERKARQEADSDKQKAQQVTRFLEEMLQGVGPAVALGQDTKMLQEILDRTAERVGRELTHQPAVEAELRNLIGTLYQRIGKYPQAEEMLRAALAIRRKRSGSESAETAATLNNLSVALMAVRKLSEAEDVLREALAIRRRLFGNEHADTATSLNDLGAVYREQGRLTEAEAMAREALGVRRKLFGAEHLDVADSLRNLCIILGDEGRWPESEAMARDVLSMRRKLLGPEHPWVASALADAAWAAGSAGKKVEAEALDREALAMRQKLLPETHPEVAKAFYSVGDRMRQQGNLNDAQTVLSAALSMQRKLLGEENPALLDTMRSLGLTLEAEGKLPESEAVQREALALCHKLGENETPQALVAVEHLTQFLIAQKKLGAAEQLLDETLTPTFAAKPSCVSILDLRIGVRTRRGQWQAAAADASVAFEHQPRNFDRFALLAALLIKSDNRIAYEQLCQRLQAEFANTTDIYLADQVAKACLFRPASSVDLPMVDRLIDSAVTRGVGDTAAMPFFQGCKALSEYRQSRFAEACAWAERTIAIPRLDAHGLAYAVLAMAKWQLGLKEEAQAMLAKGEIVAPPIMPTRIVEDTGSAWRAWLFSRVCLDEATSLIRPAPINDVKSDTR